MYDGVTLDPLETLFAPLTAPLLARGDGAAVRAAQLQRWAAAAAPGAPPGAALAAAEANARPAAAARRAALLRLEAAAMSGAACFDARFYAAAYPDLRAAVGSDAAALYAHYERFGMAEGRRHRWRCAAARDAVAGAPLQRVVGALARAVPGLPVCEGALARLWAAAGTLPSMCRAGARPSTRRPGQGGAAAAAEAAGAVPAKPS